MTKCDDNVLTKEKIKDNVLTKYGKEGWLQRI